MKRCVHCLISGRVQGVCFRAATRERARALGLSGWVCNRGDGRVEVRACGDGERVDSLRSWLDHGPPAARVERVEVTEETFAGENGAFEVR